MNVKDYIGSLIRRFDKKRTEVVVSRIKSYLQKSDKIIDIGCGSGLISSKLRFHGLDITPVDVADFHGPRLIKPIIYDGVKLPFPDKSFDTALLLMVLHHTPNPEIVFSEVARVAKNIVIIETSFTNKINRFITIIADTIGNLRTEAFWNSYKSDSEWKAFFNKYGFKITDTHKYNDINFINVGVSFLHILYSLERK